MSDDEDDEADALNFASDVAPPALEADDAFDAPVTSAAAESTAAAQGKKAKKGIGGKQVVWDENLGQYVEGSYEAEEKILTDQWIQTRYAQTLMNLKKCAMEGGTFGAALITHDEVAACEKGLLAALEAVKADQLAARKEETASAVFWAIALVQNAAARRDDGWVVDSEAAARCWDMDTLHDTMRNFKGEVHKTNETGHQASTSMASGMARNYGQGSTTGGGGGGGGKGRGRGRGMMDGNAEHKRRRLRVDELGNTEARKEKMRVLHRLMISEDSEGLHDAILNLEPPRVRQLEAPPAEAGGAPTHGLFAGHSRRAQLGKAWGKKTAQKTQDRYNVKSALLSSTAPAPEDAAAGNLVPIEQLGDDDDDFDAPEMAVAVPAGGVASLPGGATEPNIEGIVDGIMGGTAEQRAEQKNKKRKRRDREEEDAVDEALAADGEAMAKDNAFIASDDEDVGDRDEGESSGSAEEGDDDDDDDFEEAHTASAPPLAWVTAVASAPTTSTAAVATAVPVVAAVPASAVPVIAALPAIAAVPVVASVPVVPVVPAAAAQPSFDDDDLLSALV